MATRKSRERKVISAADRLFQATFGRDMNRRERKKFIFEKVLSLRELAERDERTRHYRFLRQT
jgi:hypothetical protein